MSKKIHYLLIVFTALAVLLSSCRVSRVTPTPEPTQNPNAVFTAAAQTAQARLTEMAESTPTIAPATPTETTAPSPTPTLTQLITATLPVTPLFTAAPTSGATAPPQSSSGDNLVYVEDRTIPDGTDFAPNTAFVKTWRVMNTGTTTWTTSYDLVHVGGDRMGGPAEVAVVADVAPNQSVDLSVSLVAPAATGSYTSYWRLRNASGQYFGDSIYVMIDVTGSGSTAAAPTATQSGNSGAGVSQVTMAVDIADVTAACPHTFAFTGSFTLASAATVTYELEAGSSSGYNFDLPDPQTASFPAGTHTLTFSLEITDSGSGWVKLHITAPEDVLSSQANFSLTCQQ